MRGSLSQWQRIPAELRDRAQWVVWRYEQRGDKRTKVPYSPSGKHAKSSDPTTWATFDQVIAVAERFDGIGYVFSADDPYTGCDFDAPLDAGKLATVKTLGSYTERSPSGNGLHVIVRAKLRGPGHNDQEAGREIYDSGRYFTMTGAHVEGTPTTIEARQIEIDAYYATFAPVRAVVTQRVIHTPSQLGDVTAIVERISRSRQGDEFRRLYAGQHTYRSASEADAALLRLVSWWVQGDTGAMLAVWKGSALWREERCNDDYVSRTLQHGLSGNRSIRQVTV